MLLRFLQRHTKRKSIPRAMFVQVLALTEAATVLVSHTGMPLLAALVVVETVILLEQCPLRLYLQEDQLRITVSKKSRERASSTRCTFVTHLRAHPNPR